VVTELGDKRRRSDKPGIRFEADGWRRTAEIGTEAEEDKDDRVCTFCEPSSRGFPISTASPEVLTLRGRSTSGKEEEYPTGPDENEDCCSCKGGGRFSPAAIAAVAAACPCGA
jgi:hypothetical protein